MLFLHEGADHPVTVQQIISGTKTATWLSVLKRDPTSTNQTLGGGY